MEDFAIQGRKQSFSRISIFTGLHRKEVKAIQQAAVAGDDSALDEKVNRAARVISGWRLDPEFLDGQGQPIRLPLKGEGATFETLVKRFSGNMPARAMLDELERVNAVGRTDDNWVQLMTPAYMPKGKPVSNAWSPMTICPRRSWRDSGNPLKSMLKTSWINLTATWPAMTAIATLH